MLELVRSQIRRGSRNRLILSGIVFALSAWIAGLWSIAGNPRRGGEEFWIPVCAGVVAFLALPFVIRSIICLASPTRHPAVREFGRFADLGALLASFHPDEAKTAPQPAGKVFFGRALLLVPSFGGFDLLPFREIAWIYQKTETLKVLHGLVPVAKTYSLCLRAFRGEYALWPLEVEDTEEKVQRLIAAVKEYCPWARVGWDEQFSSAVRLQRKAAFAPLLKMRDEILAKEKALQ
jgi:hypothetical protein